VQTQYVEPGSLRVNGYYESFIGKLRDSLLNGEIFMTVKPRLLSRFIVRLWQSKGEDGWQHGNDGKNVHDRQQSMKFVPHCL